MEERLIEKMELIDYAQHLLDINMQLVKEAMTLKGNNYQVHFCRRLDRLEAIIDGCIDKIQSL